MRESVFLMLLTLTLACAGQSSTPAAAGTQVALFTGQGAMDQQSSTQTEMLQFKSIGPVSGVIASPIFAVPFQCTQDGSVFLDIPNPKNLADQSIYSLREGEVRKFNLSAIPDLQDMHKLDYFPSDSMVAFLVFAIKDAGVSPVGAPKTYGETKAPSTNPNKHQYFIVEFDLDGEYKRYIQLPMDTPLFRLAVLPDDEFLVIGYDPANDVQQLLLLDTQGDLVRAIDQPLTESERSGRRDAVPWKRLSGGEASADLTTFVSYKGGVLAWRSGTNDPILEIGAGGIVREVPIALPKGSALADVVASDDQWLIHVNTAAALAGPGPRDMSSYTYYEVSPLDGSLLRRVKLPGSPPGSIACKTGGRYIAFSRDRDHKLVEFEADAH